MFVRRLVLLLVLMALVLAGLAAQAARVTIVQGDRWLAESEAALEGREWIPTTRGRILDRHGRVLAIDAPSFDLLVGYPVISGQWAVAEGERRARWSAGDRWATLGKSQRDALIREHLADTDARVEAMWAAIGETLEISHETLEERCEAIRARVDALAGHMKNRWLEELRVAWEETGRRGSAPTIDDVDRRIREQVDAHLIADNIDERRAFALRRLALEFPGMEVRPHAHRDYPHETVTVDIDRSSFPAPLRTEHGDSSVSMTVPGVATHLLGWMREVQREQIEARPAVHPGTAKVIDLAGYLVGDQYGAAGIEASLEDTLRGQRGRRVYRKDTGQTTEEPPVPGDDVQLTIDIMLQARIQALLDPALGLTSVQGWHAGSQGLSMPIGTALNAGVAVIDIDSAEVLALVSSPTFTRDMLDTPEGVDWIYNNQVDAPWANRAIAKPYQPGSILKPLVFAAAVTDGVHRCSNHIACTGHYLPNRTDVYRCWIYKQNPGVVHVGEHPDGLTPEEAMAWSCNIYFYTLGERLGPRRMERWLGRFGVAQDQDLPLADAFDGWIGRSGSGTLEPSEAIFTGIGQGPVSITPLIAADIYATLGRDGVHIAPRLTTDSPVVAEDLRLDRESVRRGIEGLRQSLLAEHRGTGSLLRFPDGSSAPIIQMDGVGVAGKTGTAQASPIVGTDESGQRTTLRDGDHSWFVILATPEGADRPRYAISVVIEYGGSGGRVAGPVANQILRALRAEGYL
ncbi:MAG: peptidoglycan D,D-transpeptidase FtsI family protein [Phycisphaerales bacterium]